MENIISFLVFAVIAGGMGYFVYTRIKARKAKAPPIEPPEKL